MAKRATGLKAENIEKIAAQTPTAEIFGRTILYRSLFAAVAALVMVTTSELAAAEWQTADELRAQLIGKLHRDPPHRHVTKASSSTGVAIRSGLQTATTTRGISPVSSDHRHQSSPATGDAHHTKPLQLDRCLDQTLNEHEFPLRYVDSFTTSKYLMKLMPFKSQPLSTCTDP